MLGLFRKSGRKSDQKPGSLTANTSDAKAVTGNGLCQPPLDALFLPINDAQLDQVLAAWSWLGLDGMRPVCITPFGEPLLQLASGHIVQIDTLDGQLTEIADSLQACRDRLATPDGRDEILLEGLVMTAQDRGLIPAAGQCYDFRIPPILGGHLDPDNIELADIVTKAGFLSQVHRQIRALPAGTSISGVQIDPKTGTVQLETV